MVVSERLCGQVEDVVRALNAQGWEIGKPPAISVETVAEDTRMYERGTLEDPACCGNEKCGVKGCLEFAPFFHPDYPMEYRAVVRCCVCGFAEEV